MITPAQRLLSGMAPPLLAVHLLLVGMAPLSALPPPAVDHGGGAWKPWQSARIVADTRDEDDEMLLLIAEQVLPQLSKKR